MIGKLVVIALIAAVVGGGGGFAAGRWVTSGQCTVISLDPLAAREEPRKRQIDEVLRADPDFRK